MFMRIASISRVAVVRMPALIGGVAALQLDLLKALRATGTPMVVVLINGRALTINWVARDVPAILEATFPGEFGGLAVAEALFGDYNPGGKLSFTVPKTVGQIPMNFPTRPGAQSDEKGGGADGRRSLVNGVLYPFGHGLSYTSFRYGRLLVSPARAAAGDPGFRHDLPPAYGAIVEKELAEARIVAQGRAQATIKPNLMANNTLKYRRIDAELREARRDAWNRPVLWPIVLLVAALVVVVAPAVIAWRRHEKSRA